MSRLYDDLPTMLGERGIEREDSYDYGVWWLDERGRAHRLTWIGQQWRKAPERAGELYLICMSGPHVYPIEDAQIAAPPGITLTHGYAVIAGNAIGAVELLCVIPPVYEGHPDATVESLLDGWAEACGTPNSVGWVRDRVREAIEAGWAQAP